MKFSTEKEINIEDVYDYHYKKMIKDNLDEVEKMNYNKIQDIENDVELLENAFTSPKGQFEESKFNNLGEGFLSMDEIKVGLLWKRSVETRPNFF